MDFVENDVNLLCLADLLPVPYLDLVVALKHRDGPSGQFRPGVGRGTRQHLLMARATVGVRG